MEEYVVFWADLLGVRPVCTQNNHGTANVLMGEFMVGLYDDSASKRKTISERAL